MKIAIGIPCYDGKVHWETAQSLIAELMVASQLNIHFNILFHAGNSIITRARNLIVMEFLKSDNDYLMFVDNDISWPPGKICELARKNVDIVGGAYRARKDPEQYMVRYLPKDELWAENGLIEVEGLPGGFMCISRQVLETMVKNHPELEYEEGIAPDKIAYRFFDFAQEGNIYWGEDMWFCRLARRNGFKIWLHPEIEFSHIGYKAFQGTIGKFLKERNHVPKMAIQNN